MSVNTENTIYASEASNDERTSETITGVLSKLIKDCVIGAILEPLNAQISTLTQLLNQLIQDNLAKRASTEKRGC